MAEVTHLAGRVICVFHQDDVETFEGFRVSDLVRFTQECFDFDEAPNSGNQNSGDHLLFRDGLAEINQKTVHIGEMRVFNDMVIVQCKRTEFADDVMYNFFERISERFGFPLEFPRKIYHVSSVSAKFSDDLQNIFEGIDSFIRIIQGFYDQTSYFADDIRLNRLCVGGDATKKPKEDVSRDLIIERRANTPFEENRFFLETPFSSEHCEVLVEKLETLTG